MGIAGAGSKLVDVDRSAVEQPGVLHLATEGVVVHGNDERGGLRRDPVAWAASLASRTRAIISATHR